MHWSCYANTNWLLKIPSTKWVRALFIYAYVQRYMYIYLCKMCVHVCKYKGICTCIHVNVCMYSSTIWHVLHQYIYVHILHIIHVLVGNCKCALHSMLHTTGVAIYVHTICMCTEWSRIFWQQKPSHRHSIVGNVTYHICIKWEW